MLFLHPDYIGDKKFELVDHHRKDKKDFYQTGLGVWKNIPNKARELPSTYRFKEK